MNEVDRWLSSGAGAEEGFRLLRTYAPSPWTERLVKAAPRFGWLLAEKLSPFASAERRAAVSSETVRSEYNGSAFRKTWPFLGEPDCPAELKILAADMITAWHEYFDAHEGLYRCETPEECFECAKKVVENFTKNRKIRSEFTYYKEHHQVLGKHPIFEAGKRTAALRKAPVSELFRRRENLLENIWRIKSEIRKGNKPELLAEREERLRLRERELEEVNRIIKDYDDIRQRPGTSGRGESRRGKD